MSEWFTLNLDYGSILLPKMPLAEILLRGSCIYIALCVLLRVIPKRDIGSFSPNDLLILLLVGEIAGNAVSKNEMSIPDALLIIGTVQLWSLFLNWLGYHFPKLRPILEEPPSVLVRDGQLCKTALRKELITREELLAELRKQGIGDVKSVKLATLESDGNISIVKREEASPEPESSTTTELNDPPTKRGLKDRLAWHEREIDAHLKEIRRLKARLKESK